MLDGIAYGGTFNLITQVFTEDSDIWPENNVIATDINFKNTPYYYEHLVIPIFDSIPEGSGPDSVSLQFKIDGKSFDFYLLVDEDGNPYKPQAGYAYDVTITVNKASLKVSTVNVTPWQPSSGWGVDIGKHPKMTY